MLVPAPFCNHAGKNIPLSHRWGIVSSGGKMGMVGKMRGPEVTTRAGMCMQGWLYWPNWRAKQVASTFILVFVVFKTDFYVPWMIISAVHQYHVQWGIWITRTDGPTHSQIRSWRGWMWEWSLYRPLDKGFVRLELYIELPCTLWNVGHGLPISP